MTYTIVRQGTGWPEPKDQSPRKGQPRMTKPTPIDAVLEASIIANLRRPDWTRTRPVAGLSAAVAHLQPDRSA
jgi:hypothetical protein